MADLKTKLDSLDVDKRKTVPAALSKLSDVIDNDIVKKTAHDKLVVKGNAIDTKTPKTSGLVTKTKFDSDKQRLEKNIEDPDKKIPNTSKLVKKNDYKTKTAEIENKIPSVTGLVTTAALNTKATATEIENKILDITNLATKTFLITKLTQVESKIPEITNLQSCCKFSFPY